MGLLGQELEYGLLKLFAHTLRQIGMSYRLPIGLQPEGVNGISQLPEPMSVRKDWCDYALPYLISP